MGKKEIKSCICGCAGRFALYCRNGFYFMNVKHFKKWFAKEEETKAAKRVEAEEKAQADKEARLKAKQDAKEAKAKADNEAKEKAVQEAKEKVELADLESKEKVAQAEAAVADATAEPKPEVVAAVVQPEVVVSAAVWLDVSAMITDCTSAIVVSADVKVDTI